MKKESQKDSKVKKGEYDDTPNKRIVITYTDDLNLINLDTSITKCLTYQKEERCTELERFIELEKRKLPAPKDKNTEDKKGKPLSSSDPIVYTSKSLTLIEKRSLLQKINEYQKELDQIKDGARLENYLKETRQLLEDYKNFGIPRKVLSFKSNKSTKVSRDITISPKTELIYKFIKIAEKYVDLNITREVSVGNVCPGCQFDMDDIEALDESGLITCPRCGYEKYTFSKVVSENVASNNSGYETFYKGLMKFQGKYPTVLPKDLFKDLDSHFRDYGLPYTSEEVLKLEINKNGKRGNTDRDIMFRALKEKGYSAYYEDINLICNLYWGWPLPDASPIEDRVLRDYEITEEIFLILPEEYQNNMNSQWRLFKHLELRQFPCTMDDFKIITTRNILQGYDKIWEMIISIAKKKYPDEGFFYKDSI
jgi:Zn ribbon nucleic-acid-binding protein